MAYIALWLLQSPILFACWQYELISRCITCLLVLQLSSKPCSGYHWRPTKRTWYTHQSLLCCWRSERGKPSRLERFLGDHASTMTVTNIMRINQCFYVVTECNSKKSEGVCTCAFRNCCSWSRGNWYMSWNFFFLCMWSHNIFFLTWRTCFAVIGLGELWVGFFFFFFLVLCWTLHGNIFKTIALFGKL